MIDDKVIHRLHLKYRKDKRVVRFITEHPILFTKYRMGDDNDMRPIRIRYFGVFHPKKKLDYYEVIKQK